MIDFYNKGDNFTIDTEIFKISNVQIKIVEHVNMFLLLTRMMHTTCICFSFEIPKKAKKKKKKR